MPLTPPPFWPYRVPRPPEVFPVYVDSRTAWALGEVEAREKIDGWQARFCHDGERLWFGLKSGWRVDSALERTLLEQDPWVVSICEMFPGLHFLGEVVGPRTVYGPRVNGHPPPERFVAFDLMADGVVLPGHCLDHLLSEDHLAPRFDPEGDPGAPSPLAVRWGNPDPPLSEGYVLREVGGPGRMKVRY